MFIIAIGYPVDNSVEINLYAGGFYQWGLEKRAKVTSVEHESKVYSSFKKATLGLNSIIRNDGYAFPKIYRFGSKIPKKMYLGDWII